MQCVEGGKVRPCNFAFALCLGIKDYQQDTELPEAPKDAERMGAAFKGAGCLNPKVITQKEDLTEKKIREHLSEFVSQTILHMEEAEVHSTLLVALHGAAHGVQPDQRDTWPFVVPTDRSCSSDPKDLIDIDELVVKNLREVRLPEGITCYVWVILDTCRTVITADGMGLWIIPWMFEAVSRLSDVLWSQESCSAAVMPAAGRGAEFEEKDDRNPWNPYFLFLFACEPGRTASDRNSLSSALVKSFQRDGISIRDACYLAADEVKRHQKRRPARRRLAPPQRPRISYDTSKSTQYDSAHWWMDCSRYCAVCLLRPVLVQDIAKC